MRDPDDPRRLGRGLKHFVAHRCTGDTAGTMPMCTSWFAASGTSRAFGHSPVTPGKKRRGCAKAFSDCGLTSRWLAATPCATGRGGIFEPHKESKRESTRRTFHRGTVTAVKSGCGRLQGKVKLQGVVRPSGSLIARLISCGNSFLSY